MIFLHRGVSPWEGRAPAAPTPTIRAMQERMASLSSPAPWSTRAATPWPSRASPSSRCSLPT